MKVHVKNKGDFTLTKSDYITEGGEGALYKKQNMALKILHKGKTPIPKGKVQELQALTLSNIINPENIILENPSNKYIGYSMKLLSDTESLCKLFNIGYKKRNNITDKTIQDLITNFKDTIAFCHNKKILIVDLNEMNFLVSKDFSTIYFIDVDSYQTPSFPATALMESIRDRHCDYSKQKNNDLTDWFSFAIVSFQMFTGIHPFKGTHKIHGQDWNIRMQNNLSIFNKDVAVPKMIQNFRSNIPNNWLQWYEKIFESSYRLYPPKDFSDVVCVDVVKDVITQISAKFKITEVLKLDEDINYAQFRNNNIYLSTNSGIFKNKNKIHDINCYFILDNKENLIYSDIKKDIFTISGNKVQSLTLKASNQMTFNNMIYVQSNSQIIEIDFTETNNKIYCKYKPVAQVLENATKVFDGVIYQNILGNNYISVFPEKGKHIQLEIKEFKNKNIIDMRYNNKVLIANIFNSNGTYSRLIIKINKEYTSYVLREIKDVLLSDIQLTVLDNGICVHIYNNIVELFHNSINNSEVKQLQDDYFEDVILFSNGIQGYGIKDNIIFNFTLK